MWREEHIHPGLEKTDILTNPSRIYKIIIIKPQAFANFILKRKIKITTKLILQLPEIIDQLSIHRDITQIISTVSISAQCTF